MTTVISRTPPAGDDAISRRIRGRSPVASIGPSLLIRSLARWLVHGSICLAGLVPASVSARTWANRPGHGSAAWPPGVAGASRCDWIGVSAACRGARLGLTGLAGLASSYGGATSGTGMLRTGAGRGPRAAGRPLGTTPRVVVSAMVDLYLRGMTVSRPAGPVGQECLASARGSL